MKAGSDAESIGRYKPTLAQVTEFISGFDKNFGSGSVAHYTQILRYGDEVMEIIKQDSTKLENSFITKSNAYDNGRIPAALGIPKKKEDLAPHLKYVAKRYFELLSEGRYDERSDKTVPYSANKALSLTALVVKRVEFENSLNRRQTELGEDVTSDIRDGIWRGIYDRETDFSKVLERSVSQAPSEATEHTTEVPMIGMTDSPVTSGHVQTDFPGFTLRSPLVEIRQEAVEVPRPAERTRLEWQIIMNDFLEVDLHSLGLFDCILTDPPYNILEQARDSFSVGDKKRALDKMLSVLKPNGVLIIVFYFGFFFLIFLVLHKSRLDALLVHR